MTLNEICNIMRNNRRGINYLGKATKNKSPIHPIFDSINNLTIKFEWADPFGGWSGSATVGRFAWEEVASVMDAECRRHAPDTRAEIMVDKAHCPMMTYDKKTHTLTMYFTNDPETASRLLHYTMLDDITINMGDFERIDKLKGAYIARVITHKKTLNTGHLNHYKVGKDETRGNFLRRIAGTIVEKGYENLFTEVVYDAKGTPNLFFWVYKAGSAPNAEISRRARITTQEAKEIIGLTPEDCMLELFQKDQACTEEYKRRRDVITQAFLSSKSAGIPFDEKRMDFIYNATLAVLAPGKNVGDVSDGYHTFNELYHHRACLFATLCNLMPSRAWKSKQHDDPTFPMYDGMFICGIRTPDGEATYHYDIDPYWDMFNVTELERAPKYDGHTPAQAIERIRSLGLVAGGNNCTIEYRNAFTQACDEFLLDNWKQHAHDFDLHTTFYIDGCSMLRDNNFIVAFRFPGATRGHVEVDRETGRVKSVQFYDVAYENKGVACYSPDIISLVLKWEGGLMPELAMWCARRCYGWTINSDDGTRAR